MMKKINMFRKIFLRGLLLDCWDKFHAQEKDAKKTVLIALNVGSTTVTSDIDISLHGIYSDVFIKIFKQEFKKYWDGASSEDVFDIGLIAGGFYRPMCCSKSYSKAKYGTEMLDSGNLEQDQINQHSWSLLRLKEYMLHLAHRNIFTTDFIETLFRMWIDHSPLIKKAYARSKKLKVKVSKIKEEQDPDLLYDNALKKFFRSLRSFNGKQLSKQEKRKSAAALKDKFSLACNFTEGMYITQGAVFHVVLKLQMKKKIDLTPAHYIDSIFENMADIIRLAGKMHNKSYKEFVIYCSKYFYRFYDGVLGLKKLGYKVDPKTLKWKNFNQNIYTKLRGKQMTTQRETAELYAHMDPYISQDLFKDMHVSAQKLSSNAILILCHRLFFTIHDILRQN